MPSSTTPHIPSTATSRSPRSMWQLLVPMIMTSVARRGARPTAGTETCASTLATATGVPGQQPRPLCRTLAQAACARADGDRCGATSSRRRRARSAGRAPRSSRRDGKPSRFRPHRLVAGGAVVARLDCRSAARRPSRQPRSGGRRARRPRAPRRGSAAPSGRTTRTRSCRRSAPATARRGSLATALIFVRLRLGGMVLPELHPGVRIGGGDRAARRAACRRPCVGSIVQAVKSMPTPMTSPARRRISVEQPRARRAAECASSRRDPAAPSPARARRRRRGAGRRSSMTPLLYSQTAVATSRPSAHVDEHGAAGLGPEVDPERRTGRSRLDHDLQAAALGSAAKASDHSSRAYRAVTSERQVDAPLRREPDRAREVGRPHPPRQEQGQPLAPRDRRAKGGPVVVGDADEDDAPPGRSDGDRRRRRRRRRPPPRRRPRRPRRAASSPARTACVAPSCSAAADAVRRADRSRRSATRPPCAGAARGGGRSGRSRRRRRRRRDEHARGRTRAARRRAARASAASASVSVIRDRVQRAARARRASVRSAPSVEPWPAKRTAGQRCSSPAGTDAQRPHGTAGSTATRSPARGPAATTPANSWPRTSGRSSTASPMPPSSEPVPVGAAEADGGDAHEHLPRRRRRVRLVVQPQVVRRRAGGAPSTYGPARSRPRARACEGSAAGAGHRRSERRRLELPACAAPPPRPPRARSRSRPRPPPRHPTRTARARRRDGRHLERLEPQADERLDDHRRPSPARSRLRSPPR